MMTHIYGYSFCWEKIITFYVAKCNNIRLLHSHIHKHTCVSFSVGSNSNPFELLQLSTWHIDLWRLTRTLICLTKQNLLLSQKQRPQPGTFIPEKLKTYSNSYWYWSKNPTSKNPSKNLKHQTHKLDLTKIVPPLDVFLE